MIIAVAVVAVVALAAMVTVVVVVTRRRPGAGQQQFRRDVTSRDQLDAMHDEQRGPDDDGEGGTP
jgi:hypothetical protein